MSSDMSSAARPYKGRILVEDKKILAATTSVAFYGLEGGIGDFYFLELIKDGSVQSSWNLFANGNTTATNYFAQYIFSDSTSTSSARINTPTVIFSAVGKCSTASVSCSVIPTGHFAFTSYNARHLNGNAPQLQNYAGGSDFTIDRLQSLTLTADAANGIGPGSRIRLFRDF